MTMSTGQVVAPLALSVEQRAALAEYHALMTYALLRNGRYGDMAYSRRWGEIERRGDELIRARVPVDGTGNFPESTPEELREAFERVMRRRWQRFERSIRPIVLADGTRFQRNTKHSRATLEAWRATARRLGVDLREGAR